MIITVVDKSVLASKMISLLLKIFIRIKSLEFEGDDEYYGEKLDYGGDFSPLNKLQSLSIGKTCFWNHNYPSNVKITNFQEYYRKSY